MTYQFDYSIGGQAAIECKKEKMFKKILLLLLSLLFVTSYIYSENSSFGEISVLVDMGLDENISSISLKAATLTSTEKMMLFNNQKKDAIVPFVVNLVVGLGIGSFIQGDTQGGLIALAGDITGFGMIVAGYGQALSSAYSLGDPTAGATMLTLGSLILLGTRVYELINPFSFANNYNSKLSSALNMYSIKVNLQPELLACNETGLKVSINIPL